VLSENVTSVTSTFFRLGLTLVPLTFTQLLNESEFPPSASILPSIKMPGAKEPERSRIASRNG